MCFAGSVSFDAPLVLVGTAVEVARLGVQLMALGYWSFTEEVKADGR